MGITILVNPSAFQNGMTLENRMKIEGAMSKNVRSSIFQKILAKTLGGYFGAKKVDFFYSKSKNGYSPMDSSSFWVKNQNLSRSFHVYQISAHIKGTLNLKRYLLSPENWIEVTTIVVVCIIC